MLNFIIDIFCKDTIIGLTQFESKKYKQLYKNKYTTMFRKERNNPNRNKYFSIDQYAYHL